MKFVSITIRGLKRFTQPTQVALFDSAADTSLTTLSGPNGSGKSAVVEALSLIQRAGLLKVLALELGETEELSRLKGEVRRSLESMASAKSGSAILSLVDGDEVGELGIHYRAAKGRFTYSTKTKGIGKKLLDDWSGADPTNLIVVIPPTKHFDESDLFYTRIGDASRAELTGDRGRDAALYPLVDGPADALAAVYRNTLADWFFDRVIPNRGYAVPNAVAKVFLTALFPHVQFANHSAIARPGEVVGAVKRTDGVGRSYDTRSLSSGEKYAYLVFALLARYAGRMGIVVFDEPENHLHETTLIQLVELLTSLMEDGGFRGRVIRLGDRVGVPIKKGQKPYISDDQFAARVLLTTHSKLVIRRNLESGSNFLLDPTGDVVSLSGDGTEERLRAAGLSQIDERVLFVEGKTDKALFERLLAPDFVEVRSLGGKAEVCAAFEGLMHLDKKDRHPGYAFVLDGDSQGDPRYAKLRNKHPAGWVRRVIELERVELENYLLEESLFSAAAVELLPNDANQESLDCISEDRLTEVFRAAADETKEVRKQQFAVTALDRAKTHIFDLPKGNQFDFGGGVDEFKTAASALLTTDSVDSWSDAVSSIAQEIEESFEGPGWEDNWRQRCKGKLAFQVACRIVAEKIKNEMGAVATPLVRARVLRLAGQTKGTELWSVIERIRVCLELAPTAAE